MCRKKKVVIFSVADSISRGCVNCLRSVHRSTSAFEAYFKDKTVLRVLPLASQYLTSSYWWHIWGPVCCIKAELVSFLQGKTRKSLNLLNIFRESWNLICACFFASIISFFFSGISSTRSTVEMRWCMKMLWNSLEWLNALSLANAPLCWLYSRFAASPADTGFETQLRGITRSALSDCRLYLPWTECLQLAGKSVQL